jgi:hypothetical protein
MSSLWTPGGERPVGRDPEPAGAPPPDSPSGPPDDDQTRAQLDELRDRLASTPAEVVIANHAFGLFELAALHLSLEVPQLDEARLAIDALAFLVEGLGSRLGDTAGQLEEGLAQLRLAYVEIHAAHHQGGPASAPPSG